MKWVARWVARTPARRRLDRVSVVLAEAVERAVTTAFTKLNGQVEAAISLEVDRQLQEIAAAVLAERLALANHAPESESPAAGKVCHGCGAWKPADQYEKNRATCRSCRRAQVRARGARNASEADRPSLEPQPG